MNLVLDKEDLLLKDIYFYESVKNTVMNDSSFIRIIYSNKDLILNGIYININLCKDPNQKKCGMSKSDNLNHSIITFIQELEKDLLNKYNSDKIQSNKMTEQLYYLINKLNNTNINIINYILKISGIWETQSIIGLTYKFIYINDENK